MDFIHDVISKFAFDLESVFPGRIIQFDLFEDVAELDHEEIEFLVLCICTVERLALVHVSFDYLVQRNHVLQELVDLQGSVLRVVVVLVAESAGVLPELSLFAQLVLQLHSLTLLLLHSLFQFLHFRSFLLDLLL